jgi:hypothetical protein
MMTEMTVRYMGHVTRVGQKKNAYGFPIGNLPERGNLEELGVHRRMRVT